MRYTVSAEVEAVELPVLAELNRRRVFRARGEDRASR